MQKIKQRTAAAVRQAARRKDRAAAIKQSEERWSSNNQAVMQRRVQAQFFRGERKQRREDYEAGRLAPRRDVGEFGEKYGTLDQVLLQNVEKHGRDQIEWWPIREGDRVVVLKGRDAGKIGQVTTVNKDAVTVNVWGLNQAEFFAPEYLRQEGHNLQPISTFTLPVSLKDVKLVYTLRDPETRIPKDVVIDKLEPTNKFNAQNMKLRPVDDWDRKIPGLNLIIPWPEKGEPEHQDHDSDTLRINVDEVTERPVLLQPPMPPSVIDELRNKYSVFRKRHDPDYVARKERFEGAEGSRKRALARSAMTPMQELKEKRMAEKATRGEPELSEEQLARIGEVMAMERMDKEKNAAQKD